jgi:hypothetical protein
MRVKKFVFYFCTILVLFLWNQISKLHVFIQLSPIYILDMGIGG